MKLVTSLAFALAATMSVAAFAADKAPADKLTPQQQKLSDCAKSAHAKSLKGDEYKSYMSTCSKGNGTAATGKTATSSKVAASTTKSPPTNMTAAGDVSTSTTAADKKPVEQSNTGSQWVAAPSNPQQEKMKACATDAKAKGLKGADRRAYMSTCLKSDKATPAATETPAKKSGA